MGHLQAPDGFFFWLKKKYNPIHNVECMFFLMNL